MSNGRASSALGAAGNVGSVVAAIPVAIGLAAGVLGNGTERPAAPEEPAPAAFASGPLTSAPTPSGFLNVYFGNLHSHTSYSDGVQTPAEAYPHARDRGGLDFLAITEHNHAQAGKIANNNALYSGSDPNSLISTANRLTENGRFVAIYGQEFSTISSGNHANVLDVGQVIDVPNGRYAQLVNQWMPAHLDTTNALPVLLLNHPATSGSPNSIEYGRNEFGSEAEWLRRMGTQAQLMAMINGPSHDVGEGLEPAAPAEGEFFRYLNLGFHVAPTADQDNHRATWGTITNARTAVVADELTKPALLRAMKARHVYATEDRNLRVICRVNGQLCGERLNTVPPVGTELQIELTIRDDDEPAASYEVDVFSDEVGGDPVRDPIDVVPVMGNTTSPLRIEDLRYTGGSQYVFFRIRQLNEDDEAERAWTAPVWIEPGATPAPPAPVLDESRFVASRNSRIYHIDPNCRDAQAIKASNKVTGLDAKRDRTPHVGCPR